jgi:hypothetical protein
MSFQFMHPQSLSIYISELSEESMSDQNLTHDYVENQQFQGLNTRYVTKIFLAQKIQILNHFLRRDFFGKI